MLNSVFQEAKRIEWTFAILRWLYVPALLYISSFHNPASKNDVVIIAIGVGLANSVCCFINWKNESLIVQRMLGFVMLSIDALAAWAVILLFVGDFYTAVYAIFALIIIEAAIRFNLLGSLIMYAFFASGLYVTWLLRAGLIGVRFSQSGYIFWTGIMLLVSVMVGLIVLDGRRQRKRAELLATEKSVSEERQRISNDLHNTVLKSLHGLTFEVHTLKLASDAKLANRVQYIEDVCQHLSQEIRQVIFEVREQDSGDIAQRINLVVQRWNTRTEIPADCALEDRVVLAPIIIHNLILAVEEVLTNVERHSNAGKVRLSSQLREGKFILEIVDDGHGFKYPDNPELSLGQGKLGLISMKERIERTGGNFELKSDSKGTLIRISFPYP